MLTLQQLITPPTEDQALASLITILQQLGFQATSWQSGSIQVTFLRMMSRVWSSLATSVQQIAAGGFTTLAGSGTIAGTSAFLTLLALYVYNLERVDATSTIGQVLFTSSAAAPIHTWAAGDIIVSDQPSGTAGANTYACTAGGTLGPSSTVLVEFAATIAGVAGNIATGTTLYLWTPRVGIVATNPAFGATGTWITTPGQDAESDASLVSRCIGRWSQLTYGNINGAYEAWARAALPSLTRVRVSSAPGDGSITIIGATALGPIDAGQITTITDYINGTTDGVGRRPLNDIISVVGATTVSPALTVTAYALSSVLDTIAATIGAALASYIGTVPIGGNSLQGTQGRVLYSQLLSIVQQQTGVKSALLSITSDVLLNPEEIYSPVITVNVQAVAPGV